MKLWQNNEIVNALKRILESYNCLQYDEAGSQRFGCRLRLRIINPNSKNISSVIQTIRQKLNEETGRSFNMIGKASSTYSIREYVCKRNKL